MRWEDMIRASVSFNLNGVSKDVEQLELLLYTVTFHTLVRC